MQNRECATATVGWGWTKLVSCVALHSPVSGVATPEPRPSRLRWRGPSRYPVRVPVQGELYALVSKEILNVLRVDATPEQQCRPGVAEIMETYVGQTRTF